MMPTTSVSPTRPPQQSTEHPRRLYGRNRLSVIARVSQITKRVTHNPYRNHPHIKGLRYVIFPNNVYLQWWDFLMILAVIYYSFALPWQFGIGGGCEFLMPCFRLMLFT